eukprot:CAMPEP_0206019182 /NCGR_PEP_ID=MMETSP1464-20131121/28578_1 /ASSEMBLY_ACC=CAM_ASM_001124 /TAXON_ID=119497 /ORGANISM="Exanthemachrysis gayraliae, Strain RCC1523" /LENGTH=53 /DNA_ID=CAMNT_0053393075 /DNA_START=153 /DNA_END=310 /DNA_ORIENTATION=-
MTGMGARALAPGKNCDRSDLKKVLLLHHWRWSMTRMLTSGAGREPYAGIQRMR